MPGKKDLLANSISTLKQQRDELALKIHLGATESKEEWDCLRASSPCQAYQTDEP